MTQSPPIFEPAVRDPRKLRNTAFILIGIMIFGGYFILQAYEKWTLSQAKDDRPAMIYRITKERDLRMLRQDGQEANIADLRGSVIAINVFSLRDPDAATRSMAVMKRLSENRASEKNFTLISLLIDPYPADVIISTLAETAASKDMKLPQWWLGSNEPKTLHKFIKNELKANTYPNEITGKWDYDAAIVLIDKNGHIRRAVVPQTQGGPPFIATFDFDQAAAWDTKGAKTGTPLNNSEQLEFLLNHTIDKLLAEPAKDK